MICVIKPAGEILVVYQSLLGLLVMNTTMEKLIHQPRNENK